MKMSRGHRQQRETLARVRLHVALYGPYPNFYIRELCRLRQQWNRQVCSKVTVVVGADFAPILKGFHNLGVTLARLSETIQSATHAVAALSASGLAELCGPD